METIPDGRLFLDGCVLTKQSDSTLDLVDACEHILNDPYYNLVGNKVAIILNHYKYDKDKFAKPPGKRVGTHKDKDNLGVCLENLGFTIRHLHEEKTVDQIGEIFDKLQEDLDSSSTSCLAVFIMTHGREGGNVLAHDGMYNLEDTIFSKFTTSKSKLGGIPKLFFIQACRGDRFDKGKVMFDGRASKTDGKLTTSFKIPSHTDMLIMYSSYEGFASWREEDGSWFMQALCKLLTARHKSHDLLQILTLVISVVSRHESQNSKIEEYRGNKQTPQITSTLTKLLKFGAIDEQL